MIEDTAIVEIKCPFVARDTISVVEAVHKKLVRIIILFYKRVIIYSYYKITLQLTYIYFSFNIVLLIRLLKQYN